MRVDIAWWQSTGGGGVGGRESYDCGLMAEIGCRICLFLELGIGSLLESVTRKVPRCHAGKQSCVCRKKKNRAMGIIQEPSQDSSSSSSNNRFYCYRFDLP